MSQLPLDAPPPIHDPDLYARLSVPKAASQYSDALKAFYAEVRAAREKYGLQNVVCLVAHPVQPDEGPGPAGAILVVQSNGDAAAVPVMLAAALGSVRRERDADLDELAGGKPKASKRTPRQAPAK